MAAMVSMAARWRLVVALALVGLVMAVALVLSHQAERAAANPLGGVASVSAGTFHTCSVTTAGGVKCWGDNAYGQLGDGTTTDRSEPTDVTGLTGGVAAIAAGANHTCAVTTGGGVKCWGRGDIGQLGGSTGELCETYPMVFSPCSTTPVDVSGLTNGVAAVAAGSFHTCALTTAGGVKCWGSNGTGQLGASTTEECTFNPCSTTLVDVTGLTAGVAAIAAGGKHTCALTAAGGVKCWGHNAHGELGGVCGGVCTTPVDVTGLTSGVAAVGAGLVHTCAVTTAGGAKCWGDNRDGQLGASTAELCASTPCSTTPLDVTGLTGGVAAVAGGFIHSCALTTAGGVKCWGSEFGSVPVDVTGLTGGVAAVAAGLTHTCAVTTAGALKCWGANAHGQLGDGQRCGSFCAAPVDVVELEPKATPTPTACPPAGCAALPPCPAPCMALAIVNADCSGAWPAVTCTAYRGVPFALKIAGRVADPRQISVFATLVYLDDGLSYTAKDCSTEVTMEPQVICLSATNETGGVGHGNLTGLGELRPGWTNAPNLVEMPNVQCDTPGAHKIILAARLATPPSPAGGSQFVGVTSDVAVLLNTTGVPQEIDDPLRGPITVDVADTLTVNCVGRSPSAVTPLPTATPAPYGGPSAFPDVGGGQVDAGVPLTPVLAGAAAGALLLVGVAWRLRTRSR